MEAVETILIEDKEQDDDAGGHADRQAGDIDDRVDLIFPKVAPGDLEIVPEHMCSFEHNVAKISPFVAWDGSLFLFGGPDRRAAGQSRGDRHAIGRRPVWGELQ